MTIIFNLRQLRGGSLAPWSRSGFASLRFHEGGLGVSCRVPMWFEVWVTSSPSRSPFCTPRGSLDKSCSSLLLCTDIGGHLVVCGLCDSAHVCIKCAFIFQEEPVTYSLEPPGSPHVASAECHRLMFLGHSSCPSTLPKCLSKETINWASLAVLFLDIS